MKRGCFVKKVLQLFFTKFALIITAAKVCQNAVLHSTFRVLLRKLRFSYTIKALLSFVREIGKNVEF